MPEIIVKTPSREFSVLEDDLLYASLAELAGGEEILEISSDDPLLRELIRNGEVSPDLDFALTLAKTYPREAIAIYLRENLGDLCEFEDRYLGEYESLLPTALDWFCEAYRIPRDAKRFLNHDAILEHYALGCASIGGYIYDA